MVCINELPGMGGVEDNTNFILNCAAWNELCGTENEAEYTGTSRVPESISGSTDAFCARENTAAPAGTSAPHTRLALGPITGAVENAGWPDEKSFYQALYTLAVNSDADLCIGDGTPDEKLLFGAEAVRTLSATHKGLKASVFIKPYENRKILERSEWAEDIASTFGVDIDAYNIVTMRNKAHLEKKDTQLLLELKKHFNSKGFPFIIKGIFREEDISLVREVKPDVTYISNHGGRVQTKRGSTAQFLAAHSAELKKYSGKVWIDGGIRTLSHAEKALSLGADKVLLGRPFITALERGLQKLTLGEKYV